MPPKKDQQQEEQTQDIKLIELLSNKPSEPIQIEGHKVYVVFQAPPFTEKYKGRSWASKKIKEIGIEEEDDQDLVYYFRYWGTLNTYVKTLYAFDQNGPIKIGDKTYSEYKYNPETDLNYRFLFEKYVLEEMYPRGLDEQFVTACVLSHMNWVKARTLEESDIKKD